MTITYFVKAQIFEIKMVKMVALRVEIYLRFYSRHEDLVTLWLVMYLTYTVLGYVEVMSVPFGIWHNWKTVETEDLK